MCSPNGFLDIVCSGVRLESWKLTFRICWHQQNRLRSAYWHMTSQINLGIMQKVAALHCTLSVREPFAGDDTSNGSNGSSDFTTSIPLTFLNFHPKSSWSRDFTNISQWEILKHLNCYLDAENDPSPSQTPVIVISYTLQRAILRDLPWRRIPMLVLCMVVLGHRFSFCQ